MISLTSNQAQKKKRLTFKYRNPQQLGQNDWRVVTINNALCYGLSVLRQNTGKGKGTPVGLIRAPYPGKFSSVFVYIIIIANVLCPRL